MKTIITATELLNVGIPENKAMAVALHIGNSAIETGKEKDAILTRMKDVVLHPEMFVEDEMFGPLAASLLSQINHEIQLREQPLPYEVYGRQGIEAGALSQINTAMKLPVARAGALMPDAHQGYGLPIGGVLATENAVIPYAVGVDIGCRMCLTLYDVPLENLESHREDLQKMLVRNTTFGRESFKPKYRKDHHILESSLFAEIPLLMDFQKRAAEQIGSSGGGNHFVEFGVVEITEEDHNLGVLPGRYFALLSHSGSRGLGANIARHYTNIAMDQCRLPAEAKHLAWLDLNTQEGQEYWLAMNLAGDYASACHHQIHERMAVGLRTTPLVMIENHHNFAWKETDAEGNEWIVHRKGATPAGKGVLGIIPGSMTDPGYIVRGKGNPVSLNSAAHGAGRAMSRTRAKQTLDASHVAQHLKAAGVHVIGSGIDEAPMAYKDIKTVMEAQKDLVDILGTFTPEIVRMCGDARFKEAD
jgi:tRNA-splicing ligase RtcB